MIRICWWQLKQIRGSGLAEICLRCQVVFLLGFSSHRVPSPELLQIMGSSSELQNLGSMGTPILRTRWETKKDRKNWAWKKPRTEKLNLEETQLGSSDSGTPGGTGGTYAAARHRCWILCQSLGSSSHLAQGTPRCCWNRSTMFNHLPMMFHDVPCVHMLNIYIYID